jgi:threonine/homoserine/homoserine lactone efflux protein
MFHNFPLFLTAAILLALLPGPGILYVATRSVAAGRLEGAASALGNTLGCSLQVVAGALGLSALVLASAHLFMLVKLAGAVYLIWMGIQMIRHAGAAAVPGVMRPTGWRRAFADGILVELFNPKTAGFFLAILPQFINPAGPVALQFLILGMISVGLNSCADLTVALAAGSATGFLRQGRWMARIRRVSGLIMLGLGVEMLFTRRSAS